MWRSRGRAAQVYSVALSKEEIGHSKKNPACCPSNKSLTMPGIKNKRLSFQGKRNFSQCHCFTSDLSHLILRQIYKMLSEVEAGKDLPSSPQINLLGHISSA
ncbi:hypothetical protein AV530_005250 [Patagioenas fasciata monilis]|uniref:Uncharacterized protein n=1 Tax=Patagioenas fasciata monilis TaxID=372326 RepID=A0A1V4JKV8_PATFA|nr:hypothetical protein AV530_005250 [Patagioenas fasciata monilis]